MAGDRRPRLRQDPHRRRMGQRAGARPVAFRRPALAAHCADRRDDRRCARGDDRRAVGPAHGFARRCAGLRGKPPAAGLGQWCDCTGFFRPGARFTSRPSIRGGVVRRPWSAPLPACSACRFRASMRPAQPTGFSTSSPRCRAPLRWPGAIPLMRGCIKDDWRQCYARRNMTDLFIPHSAGSG